MASILPVLVLGVADPSPPPLAASAAPAPIYWRQTVFSIPFHVDRPARPAEEAAEVQLFVSGDRGGRWDNWLHAAPQKGHFLFKAGVDGEYWFDVRTVDRSGQVRPQGPHMPKLIVIVDTASPKVQLTATAGGDGQMTASFRIEELYLKLDTLAIDYRLEPTAPWQAVFVPLKDVRSNNAEHTGTVTWYPLSSLDIGKGQNASGTMQIRLRVSDMAGNPAESHTSVLLAPAGGNPMRPPLAPGAAAPPAAPINPLTNSNPPSAAVTVPPANPWPPLGPPTSRTPWPAENATLPAASPLAARDNPAATNRLVSNPGPPVPANPNAAIAAGDVGPPPGVKLRWINTPDFQLNFDAHAMGVTGSVPVELWGTRDGGKTWQSFGKDPKGQSPMLVTTSEDGIYGFRMMIQSDPSMAGRTPLPGEAPGIWIGVDRTRPVGRITVAQQGLGREGDKLFIAWEASDNRELAARPISLSYSERQGGPWTAIATHLENSGRYTWQLNGNLPQRIYLRLEVQDAAGNLGIYEMPAPATLNLSTPAAPVRDLTPVGRNVPLGDPTYLR